MKRREFLKAGLITALGLIPNKASGLEVIANGKIIDTLSETPVENARLKFYSYPGNGLLKECATNSSGEYSTVPVGIGYDKWMDIKKLYNDDNEFDKLRKNTINKKVAKRADNNWAKVLINHDNYFDAGRYVDLSKNEFNTDIIPKTFDMELFDMWCRDPALGGCTQRWEEQPKWYIDTSPAYGSDKEVTQDKIDLVKEIINNDLVQFSNEFINAPYIEGGREPPTFGTNGLVLISWDDTGGPGVHAEWLDKNKIYAGAILFNTTGPDRLVYLEELTQVLGPRTGSETRNFWDENGRYLPVAYDIGKVLYSRPIGSRSPDIDPEP